MRVFFFACFCDLILCYVRYTPPVDLIGLRISQSAMLNLLIVSPICLTVIVTFSNRILVPPPHPSYRPLAKSRSWNWTESYLFRNPIPPNFEIPQIIRLICKWPILLPPTTHCHCPTMPPLHRGFDLFLALHMPNRSM